MAENKPSYQIKRPDLRFRQHSSFAQFIYNINPKRTALQTKLSARRERNFARIWASRWVPLLAVVGHLYLIALFLRNPGKQDDLD